MAHRKLFAFGELIYDSAESQDVRKSDFYSETKVFLFQMTGAQRNWSGISHKDSDKVYFD